MPKKKSFVDSSESTRTYSRRQASKEALKQMQLLLDDEEEEAFVIHDDEEDKNIRLEVPKKRTVSPIFEPSPKKKYKLSHRKSSDGNDRDVIVLKSVSNSNYVPKENTLELECFIEELSDVQKQRQKKVEAEEKELQSKINELLKGKSAEVVFKGEFNSAVEVNELISNSGKKSLFRPSQIPEIGSTEDNSSTYQLVMDPRLGIIVGTIQKPPPVQVQSPQPTKGKLQISSAVKAVATLPQQHEEPPSPVTRNTRARRGAAAAAVPPPVTPIVQTRASNNALTTSTKTNSARANRSTNNLAHTSKGANSTPTSARGIGATPVRAQQQANASATAGVQSPAVQTRAMKTPVVQTIQTRNNKGAATMGGKRSAENASNDKTKQVVDLTSDDTVSQVDNREISFNKLQGKTFPSLVIVARPHLRVTDLGADRPKLDSKVKSVLMHPPTKFTEWLIQQGLIKAEQKCPFHTNTQLKLGMYSDVSKFPFSGGYVWISECCPQRFISVFNGSIFEGSPSPPMVMLKLIYHWACQTNIQNVTQWVKVDNLYAKGVYTWLRGVCSVAVQTKIKQMGGPGCKIEVGVISLGTTSHDGNQRQVKVEVLGVLETKDKLMRLRAVEHIPDGDRNFRKKFSRILEPIFLWVHPASTIITDLTVDKATLHNMGFMNVIQTTSNDYNNSNRTIMDYLRRIVPRMFQNTLSLISRQIIQQFLDELVWREWFGITALQAFDNIIDHLAEQTRTNTQQSLIIKLNKVAANPFRSWNGVSSNAQAQAQTSAPTTAAATTSQQQNASGVVTPATALAVTGVATAPKTPVTEVKRYGRGRKSNSPQVPVVQERPTKPVSPDVPEQMVPLENYYYGTIEAIDKSPSKVTLNMKCPFCKSTFDNNLLLQNHLFKHAHNVSNDAYLCRYCLTSVATANELLYHVNKFHPGDTKFDNGFVCLICETHYMNPFVLGKHMSKEHSPHELPYECGTCSFRCSNHKQVIDHFYLKHENGPTIQCPFCLKSTTVWAGGRNIAQNVHYFIQHLQKHQKKQLAKRCGKCNLWFVQKEVLKEHQQKMHASLRGRLGLVPYSSPRNGVMVPKSKADKNPCDAEIINFSSLYYNIPDKSMCKECEHVISSAKHFPSFDTCQNPNCQYSTCCSTAMMTHNAKCKGINYVIPPEIIPFEMFCVCGYRDTDGNAIAKHLAICEKKSAYPSQAEAKSATVMHSMLDILGLVRKPEESQSHKKKIKPSSNEKSALEVKEVAVEKTVVQKSAKIQSSGSGSGEVKKNLKGSKNKVANTEETGADIIAVEKTNEKEEETNEKEEESNEKDEATNEKDEAINEKEEKTIEIEETKEKEEETNKKEERREKEEETKKKEEETKKKEEETNEKEGETIKVSDNDMECAITAEEDTSGKTQKEVDVQSIVGNSETSNITKSEKCSVTDPAIQDVLTDEVDSNNEQVEDILIDHEKEEELLREEKIEDPAEELSDTDEVLSKANDKENNKIDETTTEINHDDVIEMKSSEIETKDPEDDDSARKETSADDTVSDNAQEQDVNSTIKETEEVEAFENDEQTHEINNDQQIHEIENEESAMNVGDLENKSTNEEEEIDKNKANISETLTEEANDEIIKISNDIIETKNDTEELINANDDEKQEESEVKSVPACGDSDKSEIERDDSGELLKESCEGISSENLHEEALDDILSSTTSNVTSMEVDPVSELNEMTPVCAPMEVD